MLKFGIFSTKKKKKQIAQKIRENVVADQISAYVIYEWSLRAEAKSEEKQKQPIVFQYSSNGNTNCLEVSKVLKDWLSSINVQVAKEGKTTENSSYLRLKTTKADWRGQRGKRRADEQVSFVIFVKLTNK